MFINSFIDLIKEEQRTRNNGEEFLISSPVNAFGMLTNLTAKYLSNGNIHIYGDIQPTSLKYIKYNFKVDYIISGFITRVLNNEVYNNLIKRVNGLGVITNILINEVNDIISKFIERLPGDYLVIESCLRQGLLINIHRSN